MIAKNDQSAQEYKKEQYLPLQAGRVGKQIFLSLSVSIGLIHLSLCVCAAILRIRDVYLVQSIAPYAFDLHYSRIPSD